MVRHVLRRDDGHVLRKALEFEVRGKRKPGDQRRHGRCQWRRRARALVWRKRTPKIKRDGVISNNVNFQLILATLIIIIAVHFNRVII